MNDQIPLFPESFGKVDKNGFRITFREDASGGKLDAPDLHKKTDAATTDSKQYRES